SQLVLDEVPINNEINILHNSAYAVRETKQVKLSLIESDPILVRVLENIVKNLEIEYVHLEIRVFQDGYEFLQSDWFASGHEHILILNEIMPKINAYDVLNYLSKQPNFKKYRVFLFTNRTFNDHLMDTYSIGIDD